MEDADITWHRQTYEKPYNLSLLHGGAGRASDSYCFSLLSFLPAKLSNKGLKWHKAPLITSFTNICHRFSPIYIPFYNISTIVSGFVFRVVSCWIMNIHPNFKSLQPLTGFPSALPSIY